MTKAAPSLDSPPTSSAKPLSSPPYLAWPVSRREFYGTIWMALAPALTWGILLFGVRPLTMLLTAAAAVTASHALIKRFPRWQGGQSLVYAHCLLSAMVLVALAHPMWPVWIVTTGALIIPLLLAFVGGPGRERVHVAVALVVALQFGAMPLLRWSGTYAGGPDALLARDRLFVGDIRNQQPNVRPEPWARSREIEGNDAIQQTPPARVAVDTLNELSAILQRSADAAGLSPNERRDIDRLMSTTFSQALPGMDMQVVGIAPARMGTGSLIAIVAAGLYLSYRYILRPRSVLFFVGAFVGATVLLAIWPSAVLQAGPDAWWQVWKTYPGELVTLLGHLILNSDAGFAAVIILALPGTEPLTARSRRIFLVTAGVLGALLLRLDPSVPAATLGLCTLMPLNWWFDNWFGRRSWLNVRTA